MELKLKGIIGPQDSDMTQMRVLNRVITWNDEGIEYEPDQRHAEIIVAQMDLDNCRSASITGDKKIGEEDELS